MPEPPTPGLHDLFDLSGKVAIVTGGAKGIGRGICLRLTEAGAAVVLSDIDLEAARGTALQIQAEGGTVAVVAADASSVAEAGRTVRQAVDVFGRLDILVNNAGIYPFVPALEVSEALWDAVLDTNLKGLFFYSREAAAEMIAEGHGGKIVNIASVDAFHPTGLLAPYDASKGGVMMVTRALALELGTHNVCVNAIAPGAILTPGSGSPTPADERYVAFVERIPLGRMGTPDDVARVALFLASGAADYVTGSVVVVDGGYLQG
jgi:2-deoxy-D-gluconate 3-dehydrogenase